MSPTATVTTDRFGRAYEAGTRIVYPTRRGSDMELIEATVIGTGLNEDGNTIIFAKRKSGTQVTLRNIWDVVVIPFTS